MATHLPIQWACRLVDWSADCSCTTWSLGSEIRRRDTWVRRVFPPIPWCWCATPSCRSTSGRGTLKHHDGMNEWMDNMFTGGDIWSNFLRRRLYWLSRVESSVTLCSARKVTCLQNYDNLQCFIRYIEITRWWYWWHDSVGATFTERPLSSCTQFLDQRYSAFRLVMEERKQVNATRRVAFHLSTVPTRGLRWAVFAMERSINLLIDCFTAHQHRLVISAKKRC